MLFRSASLGREEKRCCAVAAGGEEEAKLEEAKQGEPKPAAAQEVASSAALAGCFSQLAAKGASKEEALGSLRGLEAVHRNVLEAVVAAEESCMG